MPHKVSETKSKTEMTSPAPFGPGFSEAKAEQAERMEVWGSSFSDPGPDYCEFRLFDSEGRQIGSRVVDGY